MFEITVRMPPGDQNLGFEDGSKALELVQGSIGKEIRYVGCKEVGLGAGVSKDLIGRGHGRVGKKFVFVKNGR